MRKIIQKTLKLFTKWYLFIKKPEIIAITGSMGKTTTRKSAILLIKSKYKTIDSGDTGYNTEIGLPLFILKEKVPVHSFAWPAVFLKAFFKIFFSKKIDKLVLEMGADKPGDISYFLSFIKPNISIVTAVSETHLEQFKTVDNILKEKGKLVESLSSKGTAILNFDDSRVISLKEKTKAQVITFGLSNQADINAENIKIFLKGTDFVLSINNEKINLSVKSIGKHSLYPLLATAALGKALGFGSQEIKKALESFQPVNGRMNILEGINKSYLIDDSYNANPSSDKEALKTLAEIAPGRKIAVLGTMNELGDFSEQAHKEIGKEVINYCDVLITVGDGGKIIANEAKKSGMDSKNIFIENNSSDAGEALKEIIVPDDTVLFKGSQNKVRMERAIIKVLKNPEKAKELLVRQDKFWEKKQ